MRRLQTLIAIIFETHPRPAGSRSAPMAKNHQQTSILRSTRWDSDSTLASQSVKTRPLHCDCPKTEHRKPQTAPARRQAFPKRVLGPLQPPSFLNKDFSKGFGSTGSFSREPSPLHLDPPNHALTPNVAKSKPSGNVKFPSAAYTCRTPRKGPWLRVPFALSPTLNLVCDSASTCDLKLRVTRTVSY